jgi:hypothetical protein
LEWLGFRKELFGNGLGFKKKGFFLNGMGSNSDLLGTKAFFIV